MGRVPLLSLGMSCAWLCPSMRLCAQSAGIEVAPADPAAAEYEGAVRRAIEEFDAGRWEEARAPFRRAHEISPNARTWRGLGITAFELRRYVEGYQDRHAELRGGGRVGADLDRAPAAAAARRAGRVRAASARAARARALAL